MANQFGTIKHVVQLMLENRSFDQMLGFLYEDTKNVSANGDAFDGLTGDESNPDAAGRSVRIQKIGPDTPHPYLMPGADPGEGFYNTNEQLFGTQHPTPDAVATNKGFVVNFQSAIASDLAKHYNDTLPGTVPEEIMYAYAPDMLPVMSALARGYAVCDCWFASAPTQTVPNRAFAGAATSQGRLDNHVKVFTCPSIFGRLGDHGDDWAIYGYNRSPLTRTDFPDTLHADPSHFGKFKDFAKRAAAGKLPAYTFLEPAFGSAGNSQHPNYDVAAGEQLIYDVYHAVRNGPGWNETLLVITYDEHGGNYDHVAPPTDATPPDDTVGEFDSFDFRRLGVRVPALLISPRIQAGTVFHPKAGLVDHTSVLKTLAECVGVESLTARDQAAQSLAGLITLAKPRTDDPLQGVHPSTSRMSHPHAARPSELERLHAERVSRLPIPDDHGHYRHEMPPLATSAELHDYIEGRMARWDQHLRERGSSSVSRRHTRARKG